MYVVRFVDFFEHATKIHSDVYAWADQREVMFCHLRGKKQKQKKEWTKE